MPLPKILRSFSNRRPAPSECDQQLDATRDKISFSCIRIDVKTFNFAEVRTSYHYYSSSLKQDNESYTIPKVLEECSKAGALYMMVWELNDKEIFTDKRECWKGKYCVWYPSGDGKFYLTKLADGGKGYVDVPRFQDADLKFWFLPEMRAIREKLVASYGS